ncbi:MAG: tripartite tricarboxylate transporter permease, partial [Eubacteriales bacterium]
QPTYLSATFVSMIISNIVMVIVAIAIAKVFAQILSVPYSILGPIIVMLAIIGSYATSMSIMDVKIMAIAGIAGILFSVLKFNSAALILGLVLGRICESNFARAYTMSRANVGAMFTSPISAGLMIVCIAALLYPILGPVVKKQFKLGKEYKTK